MTARLVVLASGNGSNLQAILDACADGRIDGSVVGVVTNRPEAYALERARSAGVPGHVEPVDGRERADYDAALADVVWRLEPDLVVLAGWMRILTMAFLGRFPDRVVNLHPALPGAFAGTHAIERAYEAFRAGEVDRTGVMVHLVPDEGVDDGPVLGVAEVPIHVDDDLEALEARVHATEHELLVSVLADLVHQHTPAPS